MELDLILEPDLSPAAISELGLLAERYGFRGIWTQNYSSARDAFLSLVMLAQNTRRIQVGAVIVCPFEMHPMKITNALLTLNEYAHGRAMVVIGSGGEWPEVMDSPVFKKNYLSRREHVREAIEISKRAIAETELSYEGKAYSALRFSTAWHKEKPPLIYHGACGPKMLCIGAAAADGVMMSDVMPAMFPGRLPALQRELAFRKDAGKFRISNFVAWHVREDLDRSLAEARRELIIRGWLDRDWLQPFLSEADTQFVLDNRWPFLKAWLERTGHIEGVPARITDTLVRELSLAGDYGSLDAQIERLNGFGAAGFTEIALRLHEEPAESIHLIGRKVLPALR